MANVLSLALRVTADATGLKLDPVQRALVGLGDQADKLTSQFDQFAAGSGAAAAAQADFAARSQELINTLRDTGGATQFAAAFEKLNAEARELAVAFAEGQRVTEANRTEEEKRAITLAKLNDLLDKGAISQDVFNRAAADASGANADAARAAAEAAQVQAEAVRLQAEGQRVTEANRTEEEKRAITLAKLNELVGQGAISQETFNRATAEASGANAAAAEVERARVQALTEAESKRTAVLDEGVQLAQRFLTEEEKRAGSLLRIQELLDQGAISEEVASRARAEASGSNAAAATAERERADALAAASRIIAANLTPQEQYDTQIQELQGHLDAGRLSQEQFNRAAAKAQQDLQRVGEAAGKTDKNIESLTKNVRLLSVIEVGRLIVDGIQAISNVISSVVNNIASFVSRIANSFDQFNDLSARTGIGVEALQGYSLAAKLAGVDTAEFGSAVQKLAVTIGKATPGDNLDKSLRGINLSVAELKGLAPEQQFSAIGDAISELPTAADRAAAAVEIFGKQGAALAPLFREGAASIEELRDRASRLGIIVDETQLDNIGAMNDAFDLARATVEGIAGQVVGNLAPAVTAVVDQFLKFIEEWSGAEGQGGTGIANAISDLLLDGAQVLAGVFDSLANYLSGFSVSLEQVGKIFSVVGNVLITASESFRAVFNFFQTVVSFLTERLGRFLEGLGSWVSSDLEEFGKNLANAAREQGVENAQQLQDAATNAADAFNRALDGGSGSTQQAGAGVASRFMDGVRRQFEQERSPNFRIESNIDKTGARLESFIKTVGDGADKFYLDSVETLKVFERQAAEGELTAAQIQIMSGFMETLNSQLDTEVAKRQEATEAARRQASAVDNIVEASLKQMRIDDEFGGDSKRAQAADNLLQIQQEIVRVEDELKKAREASDQAAVNALTGRLSTLDQVAAREREIAKGSIEDDSLRRQKSKTDLEKITEDAVKLQDQLLSRQFEIELERAETLASARSGSVEVNDIRSGGISAFFATLQEDPALSEAKKQTKELAEIRKGIKALEAQAVDILAGNG
jgi:hypothetical protein